MSSRSKSSRRRASDQCTRLAEEVRLAAASLGIGVKRLAQLSGIRHIPAGQLAVQREVGAGE